MAMALPSTDDMAITETTVHKSVPVVVGHHLLPGEICVSMDDPNRETDATIGVVVASAANNASSVEVKFGEQPIRTFDRARLIWLGAIE